MRFEYLADMAEPRGHQLRRDAASLWVIPGNYEIQKMSHFNKVFGRLSLGVGKGYHPPTKNFNLNENSP